MRSQEDASDLDIGLEAFNAANTDGDFAEAARIATVFSGEQLTGRRALAIALAAFNAHDHEAALASATQACDMDLPQASRVTADLVRARSMLALGRAKDAVRVLWPHRDDCHANCPLAVALIQALVDSGRAASAEREGSRLESAGLSDPDLQYHLARAALDRRRPWEALARVMRYRLAVRDDIDGMLLQATVLGYIGDIEGAAGAHEEAYLVLKEAIRSRRCTAWRLYGLAAARTGRWRQALRAARALRAAHGHGSASHSRDVEHLVGEALVAATREGPASVLAAADAAVKLAPSRRLKWVDRARARALSAQGDTVGVRRVLGLPDGVTPAAPADRVLLARALVEAGDSASALPLLRPSVEGLVPR